jgi:uncharacterized membrane protein
MRRKRAVRSTFVLLFALGACTSEALKLEDVECPDTGTELTYDSFGADFFAAHCNRCHSNASSGAPRAFNFDTHEDIRRHAARIFVRAAGPNTSMPPGPNDPPAAERDMLAEWLACGAP